MINIETLKSQNSLKFCHLNVRSLFNKIESLRLDIPDSGIDFLTISETWLHSELSTSLVNIDNYTLVRSDRQTVAPSGRTKTGGGLGICVSNTQDYDADTLNFLSKSVN